MMILRMTASESLRQVSEHCRQASNVTTDRAMLLAAMREPVREMLDKVTSLSGDEPGSGDVVTEHTRAAMEAAEQAASQAAGFPVEANIRELGAEIERLETKAYQNDRLRDAGFALAQALSHINASIGPYAELSSDLEAAGQTAERLITG
jgi:hypothetical protein